jgi:hypothetical protein
LVKQLFAKKPRWFEFFAIDFAPTSATDKEQLPVPKSGANAYLYTAAFFCKNQGDWFVYRVIFALNRKVKVEEYPGIFEKLVQGAYFAVINHKRTKDPLKYLKDIVIL